MNAGAVVGRVLGLAAIAAASWAGVRASRFDAEMLLGLEAADDGRYAPSLESLERARALRGGDAEVWEWIGDVSVDVYNHPPGTRWGDAEADRILDTAWGGYAGTVLRSPRQSWSWSGLAEIALLRASRADMSKGVDLAELDTRAEGVLDPWRAIALAAAKTAVEIKPSGFEELDVLSRVYASTGQLDAASEALARAARIMPSPSFHTWRDGEDLAEPLYQTAKKAMIEGIGRVPEFERSPLHLDVGRFALGRGDLTTAVEQMDAAVRSAAYPHERYHAYRGRAEVLEAMGRLPEAVAAWTSVIESGMAAPADRRQRGLLLRRAGRNEEACRDLRDAIRDEPSDDSLRVFASAACEDGGEPEVAERILEEGIDLPKDVALARALVDFYLRGGRAHAAEECVGLWTRDYPDQAEFREWAREIRDLNR